MNITVYLGSTSGNHPDYARYADEIGTLIGAAGHTLVYGGADGGTMGILAHAVKEACGKVIGVIPEFFLFRVNPDLDETYVVKTMAERRTKMIELGEAFLALPGGPGTIEEISEIISALRIGLFSCPCVIFSPNGYYRDLEHMYDRMVEEGFLKEEERALFRFESTPEDAIKALGM